MSKIGKACLLISGLFILASGVIRLVLNQWHDSLYVSIGLALVFFIIAVAKDFRTYVDFFTMRTTKHGMNMGALILLALVFLISLNFIAVKNDKKFDWTSEGLNSLSDQSIKAAAAVKEDLKVILLSRKEQQEESVRRQLQQIVDMYHSKNSKISFTPFNARQRPDLAQKFGFSSGAYGIFLEYKGKQMKVEAPSEEEMTKALIKMTRESKKTVYFTKGHGEHPLDGSGADGLSFLKEDLQLVYDVKEISLVETPKIAADAAAVAIIGPSQQFLETELQALRDYARAGGRLLIAADPGQQHNLAQLTKTLGVEFKNNFVLDPRASIPGMGNVAALGLTFSKASDVTKDFQAGMMAVFELASGVQRAPDAPAGVKVEEIIKTDGVAVSTDQLSEQIRVNGRGPLTLAVAVDGKLPNAATPPPADVGGKTDAKTDAKAEAKPQESQEFAAVIVGDSDFLSNKLYRNNLNRDVAMNSVSYLAKDTEMISIRPKMPKGSVLNLTREKSLLILLGFLVPLPILMFSAGGFIWYRRKTA